MPVNFKLSQKHTMTSAMSMLSASLFEVLAKAQIFSLEYFTGFQDGATLDITPEDLVGTEFEGVTNDDLNAAMTAISAAADLLTAQKDNLKKLKK